MSAILDRLWLVLPVAALLVLGWRRVRSQRLRLRDERHEVDEFWTLLGRYLTSEGRDVEAYARLTERAFRVQELLGPAGIMASFRPPFSNYVVSNYEIVVNMLPALRRSFEQDSRWDSSPSPQAREYGALFQEAILRYFGWADDGLRAHESESKKPIVWLREGVAAVLLVPIQVLSGLGVIGSRSAAAVGSSWFFRVFSGLVGAIGLLGSIVTIALGWSQFIKLLRSLAP